MPNLYNFINTVHTESISVRTVIFVRCIIRMVAAFLLLSVLLNGIERTAEKPEWNSIAAADTYGLMDVQSMKSVAEHMVSSCTQTHAQIAANKERTLVFFHECMERIQSIVSWILA